MNDDTKEKAGTVGEGVSDRATRRRIYRRTSTQHKSGTKRKEEDNFTDEVDVLYPVHRTFLL